MQKVATDDMTYKVWDKISDGGHGSYSFVCAHGEGQSAIRGLGLFACHQPDEMEVKKKSLIFSHYKFFRPVQVTCVVTSSHLSVVAKSGERYPPDNEVRKHEKKNDMVVKNACKATNTQWNCILFFIFHSSDVYQNR